MDHPKTSRNALCACGSGKKFKRCCGSLPTTPQPAQNEGLARALAFLEQGDLLQAEILLAGLIKIQPDHPNVHYLSGYAALQAGRHLDATLAMRRALDLGLKDAAAYYHYACALAALGQYSAASEAFSEALALQPTFLLARAGLANCCFELRDFEKAEQHYREILAREPNNLLATHNLGQIFYLTQRIEDAIQYFQRSVEAAPDVAEIRANLAVMQEADNRLDGAESSARAALNSEPGNVTAVVALARVLRRRAQTDDALAALTAADLGKSMPRTGIAFWSERGQILDSLGRYDEAFEAFAKSKSLLSETRTQAYERQTIEHALARERAVMTPERVKTWTLHSEPNSPAPLFVVGFPRSGTTLLEQMLGCHSAVAPCGELETAMEREASSPDYPENLVTLPESERIARLSKLREAYLSALSKYSSTTPGARYASDKLPLNLMRIGLIRILLPESRIIHVVRHPLDAVLSAYFTPFLFGHEWSLRLSDTAHMFAQSWRHAEVMRNLPGVEVLRVRYEDLVTDPESTLKQALSFLDLTWEPACLNFHQSDRNTRTASYSQVTRALYQTSKNRYLHYLEQVDNETLALLAPVIAEAGYALEDPRIHL